MLLTFFVLLSVALAVWGLQGSRGQVIWGLLLAYGAAALAVLTKGPVGFLLPAFIVFLYFAVYRAWRRGPFWVHPLGLALFGAVAAPWYVLFARAVGGGPVWEGLWRENFSRYLVGYDHLKPPWYYIPDLLLDFLPWSLFLLPALIYGFLQIRQRPMAFLTLWFAVIFLFFSASWSKRSQYLLPLDPAASLLSAALIEEQLFDLRGGWQRFVSRLFETSMALLALGALGGFGVALWRIGGDARALLPLLAVGLATGGLAFWRSSLGRWREAFGLLVAGLVGLGVTASLWTLPLMVGPKSPVASATRLAELASGRQIVAYRFSKPSLQFFGGARGTEVIYRYGPPDLRELLRSGKPFLVIMVPRIYDGVPADIRERLRPLDKDFRYGKDPILVLVPAEGGPLP
jgi:4-amino-4-deoxy-L-arabinose transferase-like glycosyltransferase